MNGSTTTLNDYQIRQYKTMEAELEGILGDLQTVYTKIDDLSDNSISMFAGMDYYSTVGFINRMKRLCTQKIERLSKEKT